jgi:hypothetical protein
LGLTVFLVPSVLVSNTFLTGLLFSLRIICPAHLNLFIFIYLVISGSLNSLYSSWLCIFLHVPLSCTAQKMHLRTLLLYKPNDLSSALENIQILEAYVNTGLRSVLYISVLTSDVQVHKNIYV